jgi:uncharacterized Zn-finger protein
MAGPVIPHFTNDIGVDVVRIGAREFMCIGARPPFDHPHEYLDMGSDDEKPCPYCGTLYRYDPTLSAAQSVPAECAYTPKAA